MRGLSGLRVLRGLLLLAQPGFTMCNGPCDPARHVYFSGTILNEEGMFLKAARMISHLAPSCASKGIE